MLSATLPTLDASKRVLIQAQLAAWKAGAPGAYQQVAANIENETALSVALFADLLGTFVDELVRTPAEPERCWMVACHSHQFKGQAFPSPIPERLGRALPIGDYANRISQVDGVDMSPDQCQVLLREISMAGSSPPFRLTWPLLEAPIGGHVIWATFCAADTADCPFNHIPRTTAGVRTALGLGDYPATVTLVLLSYRSSGSSGTLELHRPTIAEAAEYSWYRPWPDPAAAHGMTGPLPPNPAGIAASSGTNR